MSKSNQKARGALRPLLCFMLIACIGGAVWLGILAYREYRDRQEGLGFYQALVQEASSETAQPSITSLPQEKPTEGKALQTTAKKSTPLPEATSLPTSTQKNTAVPTMQAISTALPQASRQPQTEPSQPETAQPVSLVQLGPDRMNLHHQPSEKDFAALQAAYPDVVGWIRLDDTIIDYPIVQGEDNDFYLHHLPDGTPNSYGCIMMDRANDRDFGDDVILLHGHHMKNGSMFASLDKYQNEHYYKQHPKFRLLTPHGDFDVAVAAAYTVDVNAFGYPINFVDEAQFDTYLEEAIRNTRYTTDVRPVYGDQLLMLSTCNYSFNNARFIVLGKILLDEME